jgi:hypothetical protein
MDAKYAEDKANNMAVLQHIIDVGAQSGVVKKDLLSILPLSQSVANAKKKFKTMKKYDLDIYDKKMRKNLTTAQLAPDSEHYFQAILRQSLESALNPKEVSKNNKFSKFTVPLLKYCKKNGLKSFMDLYMEEANQKFKEKLDKTLKGKPHSKRDKRLEKLKVKRFTQEVQNKQKARILKRDAIQTKINRRLQDLAAKLEKEKIIAEKKQLKEFNYKLAEDKRNMIDAFTKYFDDQITATKEQIEEQKQNQKVIKQAEIRSLTDWKKEVNTKQKAKLDKYLNLLEQEDERYEVENLDLGKMEDKLIKMYKKF